jgi:hypothetical protein
MAGPIEEANPTLRLRCDLHERPGIRQDSGNLYHGLAGRTDGGGTQIAKALLS